MPHESNATDSIPGPGPYISSFPPSPSVSVYVLFPLSYAHTHAEAHTYTRTPAHTRTYMHIHALTLSCAYTHFVSRCFPFFWFPLSLCRHVPDGPINGIFMACAESAGARCSRGLRAVHATPSHDPRWQTLQEAARVTSPKDRSTSTECGKRQRLHFFRLRLLPCASVRRGSGQGGRGRS